MSYTTGSVLLCIHTHLHTITMETVTTRAPLYTDAQSLLEDGMACTRFQTLNPSVTLVDKHNTVRTPVQQWIQEIKQAGVSAKTIDEASEIQEAFLQIIDGFKCKTDGCSNVGNVHLGCCSRQLNQSSGICNLCAQRHTRCPFCKDAAGYRQTMFNNNITMNTPDNSLPSSSPSPSVECTTATLFPKFMAAAYNSNFNRIKQILTANSTIVIGTPCDTTELSVHKPVIVCATVADTGEHKVNNKRKRTLAETEDDLMMLEAHATEESLRLRKRMNTNITAAAQVGSQPMDASVGINIKTQYRIHKLEEMLAKRDKQLSEANDRYQLEISRSNVHKEELRTQLSRQLEELKTRQEHANNTAPLVIEKLRNHIVLQEEQIQYQNAAHQAEIEAERVKQALACKKITQERDSQIRSIVKDTSQLVGDMTTQITDLCGKGQKRLAELDDMTMETGDDAIGTHDASGVCAYMEANSSVAVADVVKQAVFVKTIRDAVFSFTNSKVLLHTQLESINICTVDTSELSKMSLHHLTDTANKLNAAIVNNTHINLIQRRYLGHIYRQICEQIEQATVDTQKEATTDDLPDTAPVLKSSTQMGPNRMDLSEAAHMGWKRYCYDKRGLASSYQTVRDLMTFAAKCAQPGYKLLPYAHLSWRTVRYGLCRDRLGQELENFKTTDPIAYSKSDWSKLLQIEKDRPELY